MYSKVHNVGLRYIKCSTTQERKRRIKTVFTWISIGQISVDYKANEFWPDVQHVLSEMLNMFFAI